MLIGSVTKLALLVTATETAAGDAPAGAPLPGHA